MLLLAANECHGIIANARWIISLMVQYNVRHLALSLWWYPDPCITARLLNPARFNALLLYVPSPLLAIRTADPKNRIICQTVENKSFLERLSCILHAFAKGYQGYKSNFGFHVPLDLQVQQI